MIRVRRLASLTGAVVTAGLVLGLASPASAIEPRSGLYSNLQFCFPDPLGIMGVDCSSPPKPHWEYPTEQAARDDAAKQGKEAMWCVLPIANQAVLCQRV